MQVFAQFFLFSDGVLLRDSSNTEAIQIAHATPRQRTLPSVPSPLRAPCAEMHCCYGVHAYLRMTYVFELSENAKRSREQKNAVLRALQKIAYIPQDANVNSAGTRLREGRNYTEQTPTYVHTKQIFLRFFCQFGR